MYGLKFSFSTLQAFVSAEAFDPRIIVAAKSST
jgi:hypothetical protein